MNFFFWRIGHKSVVKHCRRAVVVDDVMKLSMLLFSEQLTVANDRIVLLTTKNTSLQQHIVVDCFHQFVILASRVGFFDWR